MKFEIFGEPVRVIANDGVIVVPFSLSSKLCKNHGNKVKLLDSRKNYIVLVNPDNSKYDSYFSIVKLNSINTYSVSLWRLCKENYINYGDYLYAYHMPDGVLITTTPTAMLSIDE